MCIRDSSSGEVKELTQFLHEFKDCFAVRGQSLGRTSLVQHRINTEDTTPIRQPPRRPPLSKQEEMCRLVQDMLTQGIIQSFVKYLVFSSNANGAKGLWVTFLQRLPEVEQRDKEKLLSLY